MKKKKKERVLCVYDTLNGYLLVAQFDTLQDLADYFGTTKNSITCTVSRKDLVKCRYLIEWIVI